MVRNFVSIRYFAMRPLGLAWSGSPPREVLIASAVGASCTAGSILAPRGLLQKTAAGEIVRRGPRRPGHPGNAMAPHKIHSKM